MSAVKKTVKTYNQSVLKELLGNLLLWNRALQKHLHDTNAKLTETSSEGGIQEVTILFTYKYTHPKIVLYMEELPVETFTVVDDNTISVTEDGVTLNYKKQ